MSLVRVHNFAVSLDGFGTGEGQSADLHFGHAGDRLHEWMFSTQSSHERWDGTATPTSWGQGDPTPRPHRLRLRRLLGDDDASALPPADERRGRTRRTRPLLRLAVRPRCRRAARRARPGRVRRPRRPERPYRSTTPPSPRAETGSPRPLQPPPRRSRGPGPSRRRPVGEIRADWAIMASRELSQRGGTWYVTRPHPQFRHLARRLRHR